jgi:Tfp pilus assembly ATPase PilU
MRAKDANSRHNKKKYFINSAHQFVVGGIVLRRFNDKIKKEKTLNCPRNMAKHVYDKRTLGVSLKTPFE